MPAPLDRREFLRLSMYTVAVASTPIACGDDGETKPEDGEVFPQGVASGDPKPDSVVLWTRVGGASGAEDVELEVSLEESFATVLPLDAVQVPQALPQADHTVRVKLTGLTPYTTYYYRFSARGKRSGVGRTRTAPSPDQDVTVKLAFASCQDFVGRYWHAWDGVADEDLDFVLHLGDYIYETTGDPRFQETVAPRRKISLPDGTATTDEAPDNRAALTLADYRSIYKQYRSDPALQKVHARFPFVNIWDDHEFSDDCWGDHGTYSNERRDEADPVRRHAANRAWYEYQPADVPFDDVAWPQDIRIHRSMRFGKHVELFLLDERSYRDDHLIPEGPAGTGDLLYKGEFSSVGARHFVLKAAFDALEAAASPPKTMLGGAQKAWLVEGVKASDATWKVIGSQVQLAQMTLNLKDYVKLPPYDGEFYVTCDQWDGYRTERGEILAALQDVPNLVTFCGDIHAFYVTELRADPDDPTGPVAAVEFTGAGISSQSMQDGVADLVNSSAIFKELGLDALVPLFDQLLTTGSDAAKAQYVDAISKSNGIALAEIGAGEMKVEFRIWDTAKILEETHAGPAESRFYGVTAGVKKVNKLG